MVKFGGTLPSWTSRDEKPGVGSLKYWGKGEKRMKDELAR
jgi:hypothetical protein